MFITQKPNALLSIALNNMCVVFTKQIDYYSQANVYGRRT